MKSRRNFFSILIFLITVHVILVQGNDNSLSVQPSTDDHCHPWSFYNQQCECYRNEYTDDIVKCTEHGVLLRYGYCMTFKKGEFYVGQCTNYFDLSKYNISDTVNYIKLPDNVSDLNEFMCTTLNRKNESDMCGECIKGYGISLTSITPVQNTCEKCSDSYWLYLVGYLLLKFLQIVLAYCVILILRIKFYSSPLMVFVLHCQIQNFIYSGVSATLDSKVALYWKVLITFYGIFNLDFYQYIIPAFCIHPSLKTYQVAFFEYISFIYLLLLLIFTRICMKLHSNDFRLIILLWNKLNRVLVHINARWDKIIDAFVTVFFLSYANLVFTSLLTAMLPVKVWNTRNFSVEWHFHIYLNPDIEYFGKEHFPYVFVSSLITIFIVLPLPILLALYPIKCFRSLLFRYPIFVNMGTINAFLDKFYYCYRDGLNGGRDMRSFASFYYFVYWLNFGLTCIVELLRLTMNVNILLFGMLGFLIAVVRPYKRTFMNVVDTLILANTALIFLLFDICRLQKTFSSTETCFILFSLVNTIVPLAVIIIVISYRVFSLLKKSSCCRQNVRDIHNEEQTSFTLDMEDTRETPDHLLHSEQHHQENNNYGSTEQVLAQSYPI